MRHLLSFLLAFVFLFALIHPKSIAYFEILGINVPNISNDFSATYSRIKDMAVEKVFEIAGIESSNPVNPQTYNDDDLIEIILSEKQLNELISKYGAGKEYAGYKLDEVDVTLSDGKAEADITIRDTFTKVYFKTNEFGTRLEIIDIDTKVNGKLDNLKNQALKTLFHAIQPKIIDMYLKDFAYAKLETGRILIYLKKEN